MQLANAGSSYTFALLHSGRIPENDAIPEVAPHLPEVARVSLGDVHDVKGRLVFISLVQFVERGNLPAKGRSSVAAEH
jgi:hypothetical protein